MVPRPRYAASGLGCQAFGLSTPAGVTTTSAISCDTEPKMVAAGHKVLAGGHKMLAGGHRMLAGRYGIEVTFVSRNLCKTLHVYGHHRRGATKGKPYRSFLYLADNFQLPPYRPSIALI